jgi:hypothetical protein
MRGFKLISMVAVLLYFLSVAIPAWLASGKNLNTDAVFQKQLLEMNSVVGQRRLFIYGSSGLLVGISAILLESMTKHSARNLSTGGLGGQNDLAISLMISHAKPDDIILIGDRGFRGQLPVNNPPMKLFVNIKQGIKIIPNVANYFYRKLERTDSGDIVWYPPANILPEKYDPNPTYTSANIELMKRQADLVKQGGGCPVLVLVPILVKENEKSSFEIATKNLLSLANSAGLSDFLLHLPSIEVDKSLFVDQYHMSESGRKKWTEAIGRELLERNLCNIRLSGQ